MHKIPTLFTRDQETHMVTDTVNEECEWVFDGKAIATRKWDGTCVMLDPKQVWWARREVRKGKGAPGGWKQIGATDRVTGKSVGWVPIDVGYSFYKPFIEALSFRPEGGWTAGTYELIGPRINSNPDRVEGLHRMMKHGDVIYMGESGSIDVLMEWCREVGWEGVVWWEGGVEDSRLCKLKVRDIWR